MPLTRRGPASTFGIDGGSNGGCHEAVRRRTLRSIGRVPAAPEAALKSQMPPPEPFRQLPPELPAPRPFAERRRKFRRAEDRVAHEESALLARAIDILIGGATPDVQLAELLAMIARVVRVRRAAVISTRPVRRIAVAIGADEEPAAARPLAAWLDAHAPRSAIERAAAGEAPVAVVRVARGAAGDGRAAGGRSAQPDAGRFHLIAIRAADGVHLGVELGATADPAVVDRRLPDTTMRHFLAALSLATARAAEIERLGRLQAREVERERYTSMIVHELRTPLTSLTGYLDLILDGKVEDPDVEQEFLERGRTISETMSGLVGDLLEMSRLEAGSLSLEAESFSLADACSRALDSVEPIALARGIRLARDLPSRLRTAHADARRVAQVVTNLVANACKFSPGGGLVEVNARFGEDVAIVAVRDDGPGIEPADQRRIFEPFVRLGRHERIAGTGLGLPIARELTRAMGGDLGVASVAGSGSSFVVALPTTQDVTVEAVAAALAAAVEDEELHIEERAVMRAIRDSMAAGGAGQGADDAGD